MAIEKDVKPMGINNSLNDIYKLNTDYQDWFIPSNYAFKFTFNGIPYIMFLPINPYNINIVSQFANNLVSTLYDSVEQRSDNKYHDITISGTTGIVPQYNEQTTTMLYSDNAVPSSIGPFGGDIIADYNTGREAFKQNRGSISKAIQNADNIVGGGIIGKNVGPLVSAIGGLLGSNKIDNFSFDPYKQGGYVAFHNLIRFLQFFQKYSTPYNITTNVGDLDVSLTEMKPLYFLNYKDGIKYSVSLNSFSLTRSADNPMLYNYNISMRAYKIENIDVFFDNFNKDEMLEALGLSGMQDSIFAQIKKQADKAKKAVFAATNAIKNIAGK